MSEYFVTDDLMVAFDRYIGEVPIVPTRLADTLSVMFTGKHLPSWTAFYYGNPDNALREKFGYEVVK